MTKNVEKISAALKELGYTVVEVQDKSFTTCPFITFTVAKEKWVEKNFSSEREVVKEE
jgi:hypothetical protein